MGTGRLIRWIDAVTAGMLMLAMTAFVQSSAHASVQASGQEDAASLLFDQDMHPDEGEHADIHDATVESDASQSAEPSVSEALKCFSVSQNGGLAFLPTPCSALSAQISASGFEPVPETEGAPPPRSGWLVLTLAYKTGP